MHRPVAEPGNVPSSLKVFGVKFGITAFFIVFRPDLGTLSPAHRLDKPVSGVLLLPRTSAAAEALRDKITNRQVNKAYVARVEGMFPVSPSPFSWPYGLMWALLLPTIR